MDEVTRHAGESERGLLGVRIPPNRERWPSRLDRSKSTLGAVAGRAAVELRVRKCFSSGRTRTFSILRRAGGYACFTMPLGHEVA